MKFNKENDILEKPGIFCFRINDNKLKEGYSIKIAEEIKRNINEVFLTISKNIQNYQSNKYLGYISKKLNNHFDNNQTQFNFPGLHAINITRDQLNYFSHWPKRFLLCERSDGIRYFLIQYHGGICHLVGRNLEFFEIEYIKLPPPSPDINFKSDWDIEYLLDGELVLDDINETVDKSDYIYVGGKPKKLNFLVLDAVVIKGKNYGNLAFKERLSILSDLIQEYEALKFQKSSCEEFIKSYKKEIDENCKYNKVNKDKEGSFIDTQKLLTYFINPITESKINISIYMKDYFYFDQIETLINLMKYLPHNSNGIIINVDDYPYYSGKSCEKYKWKQQLKMNTIYFEVKYNEKIKKFILYIEGNDELIPVEILCFDSKTGEEKTFIENLDKGNKKNIIECFYDNELNDKEVLINNNNLSKRKYDSYDSVNICKYIEDFDYNIPNETNNLKGGWRFKRYRNDKLKANYIEVYINILKCIKENIQLTEIIDKVRKNREIKLLDLKNEGNFMSSLVWKKFFHKNGRNKNYFNDNSNLKGIKNKEKIVNIWETVKESKNKFLGKKIKFAKRIEDNYYNNINENKNNDVMI